MKSNFFLSLFGVAVCLLSFSGLDAAYYITGAPQTVRTQEYCPLPKWERYTHPVYALYVGAAQQATVSESGHKQAVQAPAAHVLQAQRAKSKAQAEDEDLVVEQTSRQLQAQQQAQADEILNVGIQIKAKQLAIISLVSAKK